MFFNQNILMFECTNNGLKLNKKKCLKLCVSHLCTKIFVSYTNRYTNIFRQFLQNIFFRVLFAKCLCFNKAWEIDTERIYISRDGFIIIKIVWLYIYMGPGNNVFVADFNQNFPVPKISWLNREKKFHRMWWGIGFFDVHMTWISNWV